MSVPLKIEEMFAFIVKDNVRDGDEGIMGIQADGGSWMPLVGADMDRVKSLYHYAEKICQVTGREFRIIKFSGREDITDKVKQDMT